MRRLFPVLILAVGLFFPNPSLALPSTIKTESVTFDSLPGLLDAFLKESPGKRGLDEEIILNAHWRFVEFLDPEKLYFIEEEVFPFLDRERAQEFLRECTDGSFRSYKMVMNCFQKAIERSRSIRKRWSSKVVPHGHPQTVAFEFPQNERALEAKVIRFFLLHRKFDGVPVSHKTLADIEARERMWEKNHANTDLFAEMILKSILSSLDVNSDVLAKRDARTMREKLTKEAFGTGLICEKTKEGVAVVSIQKGSPAEELGVFRKNDEILSINGKPCLHMSIEDVEELLREKEAGVLSIQYRRPAGGVYEQIVPLRHFALNEDRVTGEMHRDILVIVVPSFYGSEHFNLSTTSDIFKILSEKRSVSGVILDFRRNGGGYLTEAVRTCGLFLKTGVVMTAVYADGEKAVFRDTDPTISFKGPIVILTSEWTASAAEVVTQTLKDYGRAIVVGAERTFGKGSIQLQTITDMKSSGNVPLRYTVGKFYSVAGISPEGDGIEADISLPGFQERRMHPCSAEALPRTIPAKFYDTLEDIQGRVRLAYRKHYLPFVHQSETAYREHIPVLKKRSQERIERSFSEVFLNHSMNEPFEKRLEAEQIAAFQLKEAENILQDLLLIERKGETSVTSSDR